MADSALATLTAASALGGTELFYGTQGGADRKVTAAQLATYAAANLVAATSTVLGGVKPDGTTILNTAGAISVPTATASVLGLVKPDGTVITNSAGAITVQTATASVLGVVKPDGSTITNTAGALAVAYGTTAGTAAQGNDSRITSITANGTAAVGQLPGTATNDAAASGKVGELITSTVSNVSISTGIAASITSISLPAGDWAVSVGGFISGSGSTAFTQLESSISTTDNVVDNSPERSSRFTLASGNLVAYNWPCNIPQTMISVASTTTVYLVALAVFTVSTATAYGTISARRVR